ncbi:MAG TPA: DUF2339 domain-containing protein [Chloroflexia bacterium]|nr:DUF2339 domain-containing protein [Chloroflexia bacterium]
MNVKDYTRTVIRVEDLEARVTDLQSSILELQRTMAALLSAQQAANPGTSTSPLPGGAPNIPYTPYVPPPPAAPLPVPAEARPAVPGPALPSKPVVQVKNAAAAVTEEDPGEGLPQRIISMVGRTEFWLNKVGIVLFLFGVAFLFKYAVDRNWLNETVRVIIGGVFGTVLVGFGLYFHDRRRHFSQVLLGGGIATYYITAFAAYVLFPSLNVPYEWAFGSMATVTALAFLFSLWGDDVSLSLIGLLGGLLTPFVLNDWQVPTTDLMIYIRLLLAGTAAIYLFKGWRMLLWSSFGLGTMVLLQNMTMANYRDENWNLNTAAGWEAQATLIVFLLAFWGVPVLHQVLTKRYPNTFRTPAFVFPNDPTNTTAVNLHTYLLPVIVPLFTLACSMMIWNDQLELDTWALFPFAGAAVFGAVWWLLREDTPQVTGVHKYMAIVLFVMGTVMFLGPHSEWLDGHALYLALAVEALVLHLLAFNRHDRGLKALGGAVTAMVLIGYASSVIVSLPDRALPVLNSVALANLFVLATLAVSGVVTQGRDRQLFELFFHAGVLAWFWRELGNLPYAEGYTVLAAAAYATVLFVVAYRLRDRYGHGLTRTTAGVFYAISAIWLAMRIATGLVFQNPDVTPILNHKGLIGLGIMALGAVVAYTLRDDRRLLSALALVLHALFLGWLWQELGLFPNGNGIVTVSWGIYALAIIGAALRFNRDRNLFVVGAVTLFAVAAKLFLVDLYYLEAIWRILLFLGFGALFLVVSYYLQNITRHGGTPHATPRNR